MHREGIYVGLAYLSSYPRSLGLAGHKPVYLVNL